ncbi:MAG: 4-hydroxy-tetrahydrodipicolinate reductase [Betaproteobacteria bacterium ADurb.Bin341]|nr:MAG: 4-hydroxy-tetrahydrodipicolinate reductase [Betaproteobacteria bacterium ADurb.Bin341]
MKIGVIGFGRAGRAVSSVLLESKKTNLQWVLRRSHVLEHRSVPEFLGISSEEPGLIYSISEFSAENLLQRYPVDAIVDFSSEDGIQYYGEEAAQRGITIVSAISQYSDESKALLQRLSESTRVIFSPNITLGINFLLITAKILKNIAPYTDIEIIEEHFKQKAETSGTAKVLCNALDLPESAIKMVRAGGIIGVHEIIFGFPYQTVRLKHESISREAFGNGIMFALENLPEQKSGLYTMEDLMLPYFAMSIGPEKLTIQKKNPWWKFW